MPTAVPGLQPWAVDAGQQGGRQRRAGGRAWSGDGEIVALLAHVALNLFTQ